MLTGKGLHFSAFSLLQLCGKHLTGLGSHISTTVYVLYMYVCSNVMCCVPWSVGLPEGSRRDEVVRFLEASTLMKGIQHRHVLPVLRVSVEDNYAPLVIYPMVEYGDMHRVMKLAANPEHSIVPVSWGT